MFGCLLLCMLLHSVSSSLVGAMQNRKLADETGRQGWSKDVALRKATRCSYVCITWRINLSVSAEFTWSNITLLSGHSRPYMTLMPCSAALHQSTTRLCTVVTTTIWLRFNCNSASLRPFDDMGYERRPNCNSLPCTSDSRLRLYIHPQTVKTLNIFENSKRIK